MRFYSQIGQDRYVFERFFKDAPRGTFLEIGAYDGETFSNTLFFEEALGWRGICVEPLQDAFVKLKARRSAICLNCCIADFDGRGEFLDASVVGDDKMLSGLVESFDPRHVARIQSGLIKAQRQSVEVRRLSSILDEHGFDRIDYCSIDTEGSELKILQTIDFSRYSFSVFSIENNYGDPRIAELLDAHGFQRVQVFHGYDELYAHRSILGDQTIVASIGAAAAPPAASEAPVSFTMPASIDPVREAKEAFKRQDYGLAEQMCFLALREDMAKADMLNILGLIANNLGMPRIAVAFFAQAHDANPQHPNAGNNLRRLGEALPQLPEALRAAPDSRPGVAPRYLLIKAWGHGFWSDVAQVMTHLVVAELTGRIPVIHWGAGSLFGGAPDRDCFTDFFEPVSPASLEEVIAAAESLYPKKWTKENLRADNIARFEGEGSRMPAIALMGREERVVVADYYSGLATLRHWIPKDSSLYGLSTDALYTHVMEKWLKPRRHLQAQADAFAAANFEGRDFIAIHLRATDKVQEQAALRRVNEQYFEAIDAALGRLSEARIFLLTDSQAAAAEFRQRYGDRLRLTESLRGDGDAGIHLTHRDRPRQLGEEVLVDAMIAAKAALFIGNGASNVSAMIRYMKRWPAGAYLLLAPAWLNDYCPFIYMRQPVRS